MLTLVKRMGLAVYNRLRQAAVLNQYDDFTIGEYFRKQGAIVGENNRIQLRYLGADPNLVSIGNDCTIAPGVSFVNHDGAVSLFSSEIPSIQKFGAIKILDNCFIGLNAIILGNVKIGPNSIVAAGAVVTKDVPPGTVVGGNPARYISTTAQYREKAIRHWKRIMPEGYFIGFEGGKKYSAELIQKNKIKELSILSQHLTKLFHDGKL